MSGTNGSGRPLEEIENLEADLQDHRVQQARRDVDYRARFDALDATTARIESKLDAVIAELREARTP